MSTLNMLNTKYIIYSGENQPEVSLNDMALGNAWFVERYTIVANADEEISFLTDMDPASEAVIDQRFSQQIGDMQMNYDSLASISLTEYKPNYLKYSSQAGNPQLAVFSDIYYEKGWNAYIDGELVPHFRADYVLRAMIVPAGNHTIEFRFEPKTYYLGNKISLASSLILSLFAIGVLIRELMLALKMKRDKS